MYTSLLEDKFKEGTSRIILHIRGENLRSESEPSKEALSLQKCLQHVSRRDSGILNVISAIEERLIYVRREIGDPVTPNEIREIIMNVLSNVASGFDDLKAVPIKHASDIIFPIPAVIVNRTFETPIFVD